ncbi:protein terminus-like [Lucilia cuprina]|uniref:protein terminus-like n=1 Tax=Lucilia cuprina TaxID=7375 RepID=UPI001F067CE7|nr:protein terminus-like [Lucilia cuprina]
MSLPTPSYTFVTSAGQRQFFHRWHLQNNEVIDCNKCGTICKETDAYSQHWMKQKLKLTEAGDELNTWMRTPIMEQQPAIVSRNIQSFMFCDGKVVSDTQEFLLDVGITGIPDLLSVLYATDGCKELMVKLRFYVEIEDEMFMLQSSELEIRHHSDIRESVDVIFLMLLEKLRTFMTCMPRRRRGLQEGVYRIKRILVQTQRRQYVNNEQLQLPLQYKRKQAILQETDMTPQYKCDLEQLSLAFQRHINTSANSHFKPPFPCNLYCFQTCANSQELYAVPFHISNKPQSFLSTRSFVIVNDILGGFQQLQEIAHIKRFLHHSAEDAVLSCSQCQAKFMQPTKLSLHKMLNCGHDFEILKIDPDFIEIYEECFEIMRCAKWLLFGIVK